MSARAQVPAVIARRWAGVDAARGLAIVGMIIAHTIPRPGGIGGDELVVDGRPSILFALVAGVSLGLATGETEPPGPHDRSAARVHLLIRAVALFGVGLVLWMLPHGIAVILDYYGVLFLLALPLLFLPRRLLAGIAVLALVGAPPLRDAVDRRGAPTLEPLAAAVDYLLTGWYPALLWLPLLAVGLLAARTGLHSRRVRVALIAGGAAASVVGYGAALVLPSASTVPGLGAVSAAAHSGTVLELLGSGGLAAAILGAALVVLDPVQTDGAVDEPPPAVRALLAPLRALGRIALTVYVGHVVVIAALSPLGGAGRFEGAVGWAALVVLLTASATAGLAAETLARRGPLEGGLALLAGLPFRARQVRD